MLQLFFEAFRISLFIWQSISSNLSTQQCFVIAVVNNLFFLVSLKYRERERVTVKTVTLYEKLHFFPLKILKARKRSWY